MPVYAARAALLPRRAGRAPALASGCLAAVLGALAGASAVLAVFRYVAMSLFRSSTARAVSRLTTASMMARCDAFDVSRSVRTAFGAGRRNRTVARESPAASARGRPQSGLLGTSGAAAPTRDSPGPLPSRWGTSITVDRPHRDVVLPRCITVGNGLTHDDFVHPASGAAQLKRLGLAQGRHAKAALVDLLDQAH